MLFKVSRGESLDRIYLFKLFGFGVFLHRIHHSDPNCLYHSHPWNGVSIIVGTYVECFLPRCSLKFRPEERRSRCLINFVRAKRHHRVEVKCPTWTLFIHGRKCNQWEIVNDQGYKVVAPWKGIPDGVKSYSNAVKEAA